MGIFITILFSLAIGIYVYRIVRKSTQRIKAGKCMGCDGKCANTSCQIHIDTH
jgi:hypothetical protein